MLKKHTNLLSFLIALILVICVSVCLRFVVSGRYKNANDLMEAGNYNEAIDILDSLGDYKDSIQNIEKCKLFLVYENGKQLYKDEHYQEAADIFLSLGQFEDSKDWLLKSKYAYAVQLFNNEDYENASQVFLELGNYKDSQQYAAKSLLPKIEEMQKTVYDEAYLLYLKGMYSEALVEFERLNGYSNSQKMIDKCKDGVRRKEEAHTISAGISLSLGINRDGKIESAGYNDPFDFSMWDNIISVSNIGVISIGLKSDGTVVTSGSVQGSTINTDNWSDIIAVSAGERYVVGVKSDGTVVGQGHDRGDGQLQIGDWEHIKSITTGWRHTVGLDIDGIVHIVGYGAARQLREIEKNKSDWENIVAIAAGGGGDNGNGHTVGLRSDGTVVAVGDKSYGQCDVESWTDIVAIAAGDWHTVGLKSDGTVVSTTIPEGFDRKYTFASEVENWTDIVAVAAGCGYTLGLRSDGTVVSTGYDDSRQRSGIQSWEAITIYQEWT